MLRFILKNTVHNESLEFHSSRLVTVDVECPEIEKRLTDGGCGPDGYDMTELVGVEVLPYEDTSHETR
jgi:hypothetical protein